jgi:H+/gluconate symporter-like permease
MNPTPKPITAAEAAEAYCDRAVGPAITIPRWQMAAAFSSGVKWEHERAKALVEALGLAESAIEAMATTQTEKGMGLLGKSIVAPETLRRIREARSAYGEKEGE